MLQKLFIVTTSDDNESIVITSGDNEIGNYTLKNIVNNVKSYYDNVIVVWYTRAQWKFSHLCMRNEIFHSCFALVKYYITCALVRKFSLYTCVSDNNITLEASHKNGKK